MELLYNAILNNLGCEKNRMCINNNIDIYFNNIEFWLGAIVFLLDEEIVCRLELECDFNYRLCVNTVFIDYIA